MKNDTSFRPGRIGAYFRAEWLSLTFVTLSGLLYNVGLLAAPWFEGRLAQCLADILGGRAAAAQMAMLVLAYIAVTLLVRPPGSSSASTSAASPTTSTAA